MTTKIYDANEVTISLFGFLVEGGFADGEFVKIEMESDKFTDVAGADGEVTRSKTNDPRCTITLTLMQTADANSLLSGVAILDEKAANGAGIGPYMIRDRSGTALHAGSCWIAKDPDIVYGKEATGRAWKIRGVKAAHFAGGS